MERGERATVAIAKTDTRAALRQAVLAMARARGAHGRAERERAVRRWRVLADARLTERERQVVALYRLGAHAKLIAYELGIADATVRVLLSRAAHRLGLPSPRALRSTPEE